MTKNLKKTFLSIKYRISVVQKKSEELSELVMKSDDGYPSCTDSIFTRKVFGFFVECMSFTRPFCKGTELTPDAEKT